jgi:hypothetical protein
MVKVISVRRGRGWDKQKHVGTDRDGGIERDAGAQIETQAETDTKIDTTAEAV